MSTPGFSFASILENATSEAAAFAAGLAIAPTLAPLLRALENESWSLAPERRLDLLLAAAVTAENYALKGDMQTEASFSGWDQTRFDWAYDVTVTAPGFGELLAMLRRNDEVAIDFTHGLRKAKLETQWDDALRNLRDVRIPGPDLAYMVVRGVVPDGGTLASSLPTTADRLKLPPQLNLDTLLEASKTGWDALRFAGLVARSGLAMSPVQAAQANFRGILTDNDYELTIARGDLFPAFADPVKEVSRQILTAGEYTELQLRGWYDRTTRLANTAKHGMSTADSDLLFKVLGLPMNHRQVFQAMRRGGVYDGPTTDISAPFLKSLQESNTRPEWYNLEWFYRFTQPSVFVVRQWIKDGHDPAWARTKLSYAGWEPDDIDKFVTAYAASGTTTATNPDVKKAQTQLLTTTHRSYLDHEASTADVTERLGLLGVDAASQTTILSLWDSERALIRKGLTAKEIVKALGKGIVNPATGLAWTVAEAEAAIMALGYDQADAQTLTQE